MKLITKRIISIILSLVFSLSLIHLIPVSESTYVSADSYSPSAATAYASKYWNNYNPNYSNYNSIGGDCANFVSQCLHAGGLQMTDGWYWRSYNERSGSWASCPSMYNYFKNAGYTIIENPSADQVLEGNPVLYWNASKGRWAHAAICTGKNSSGTPVVAAHNNDRWNAGWTLGYSKTCTVLITSGAVQEDLVTPTISIDKTIALEGETINISWDTVANAQSYWLHIYKDGEDYVNQSIGQSLSYSTTYPAGTYTAYVVACNSASEASSFVEFTVFADIPDAPNIYMSKYKFLTNESVEISWNQTANTSSYWLHIYKDGQSYINQSVGQNLSYISKFPAGKYSAYVVACGVSEVLSLVEFTVYDDIPEAPELKILKETYTSDDIINVSWDMTSYTDYYWLHIYKDGEDYVNQSIGLDLSYSARYPEGSYVMYVVSCGAEEVMSYVEFTVKDEVLGDIYPDQTLNLLDIIYLQKYLMNIKTLDGTALQNADLNSDGKVNILDLALLKKAITSQ